MGVVRLVRDRPHRFDDLGTDFRIRDRLAGDPLGQDLAHFVIGHAEPVFVEREFRAVHKDHGDDADQDHHDHGESIAETAENTRHFLFMRGSAGVARIVADPACAVDDG